MTQISSTNMNSTLHTDNKNFNIDNSCDRLNFKLNDYLIEKWKFVMIEKYKSNVNKEFNETANN